MAPAAKQINTHRNYSQGGGSSIHGVISSERRGAASKAFPHSLFVCSKMLRLRCLLSCCVGWWGRGEGPQKVERYLEINVQVVLPQSIFEWKSKSKEGGNRSSSNLRQDKTRQLFFVYTFQMLCGPVSVCEVVYEFHPLSNNINKLPVNKIWLQICYHLRRAQWVAFRWRTGLRLIERVFPTDRHLNVQQCIIIKEWPKNTKVVQKKKGNRTRS